MKSEKRCRTNTVGIRVSDDELEQIQAFAASHTMANYSEVRDDH